MNGLIRLTNAAAGTVLRRLAVAPLTGSGKLLAWAQACERRASPDGAGPTDGRERLPQKRAHEAFDFSFSRDENGFGLHYTAGIGRHADGRIAELFVDCHKLASQATDDARDIGVLVSVALQYGMPLAVAQSAFTRFEDGRPCSLPGRLVDVLVQHEADRVVQPPPR